ncbi:MAG: hypothetical protein U0Q11_11240 [Vicinamibacterales bacterium]
MNVVRGSGNVFRDLGLKNSDVLQLKSLLATEIIRTLDRDGLYRWSDGEYTDGSRGG